MSVERSDQLQELTFVLGTLIGMLAFAIGLAFLILALSVGVREGTYITPRQEIVLMTAGVLALTIGIVLRFGRDRLTPRYRGAARLGGGLLVVFGVMALLFAMSAETTVSAPFLSRPFDKAVLFITSFVLLLGGLALMRMAGRIIGW